MMESRPVAWDIGHPVYPNDEYFWGLKQVVKDLVQAMNRGSGAAAPNGGYFQGILERFRDEDRKYRDDIMTR